MKNAIVSLLLVAALVITGALAFLTAKDSAENKFTVGNVDITLTEPKWDEANPDGTLENIVAGQVITKDPTITNTGVNNAYVYFQVEIPKVYKTDIAGTDGTATEMTDYPLFTMQTKNGDTATDLVAFDAEGKPYSTNEDFVIVDSFIDDTQKFAYDYYLFAYVGETEPEDTVKLFDQIQFANITETFENLANGTTDDEGNTTFPAITNLQVNVKAYAIQSDFYNNEAGEEKSAENAWSLYVKQSNWKWEPVNYEGISTIEYVNEDDQVVYAESGYAGTPVTMYFEPSLAKTGYTFDWVNEDTGDVAYSGMPMPETDTTLKAAYTETGYGEEGSTFLEYTFWYTANGEFYAAVNDVFDTHPTLPTEIPYDVVIPDSITVTIKKGSASGSYNYYGVDSYGIPIVDDIMAASAAGEAYLAQFKDQTITVPVKGLHFSVGAFENAKSLVLSDSISRAALADSLEQCQYLETIIFPYGMTQLTGTVSFYEENGQSTAFSKIPNLKNIIFPNSIEYIAPNMFTGCNALTEVDIPSSLKEARCFTKCENLKKLNFQNLSDVFECSTDAYISSGAKAYVNGELVQGAVTVPSDVKEIADFAVTGNVDITEIVIPNSVTRVGWGAFQECTNLTKVTMADSVTYLDAFAFDGCTALTDIDMSNNINYISHATLRNTGYYNDDSNWDGTLLYIEDYLIYCNTHSTNQNDDIVIKDGTKVIANRSFPSCYAKTITIPSSISTISEGMFVMAKNIESVIIPTSVTFIDEEAFDGANITNIYYMGTEEQWDAIEISDYYGDGYTLECLADYNIVFNYQP